MIRTRRPWLTRTLALGCMLGSPAPSALAIEGSLIIPEQTNSNVELRLHNETNNVNASEVLRVFVGRRNACCVGKSPMAGRYAVNGESVMFDPAFDFIEGQYYTIMTRDEDTKISVAGNLKEFVIQSAGDANTPEVNMIYPSGTNIPENTLRFYIHFSTPMQPHVSTDFIKLVDENGKHDSTAFMVFKQELWSEDRKRLTLLMDPGRIKRGVAQNLTMGPALVEGNTYSIVVEEGWPVASGFQTMPGFVKNFSATSAIRTLPDTNLWLIQAPVIETHEPLTIEFDRPFDHQFSQSGITVLDKSGHLIPGVVSVENDERTWLFEPLNAWSTDSVKLAVDARLEDVAGNNFNDLLDHSAATDVKDIDKIILNVELLP